MYTHMYIFLYMGSVCARQCYHTPYFPFVQMASTRARIPIIGYTHTNIHDR